MELNKINYKKGVKVFKPKKPVNQWRFFTWLARFLSAFLTAGKLAKIEKIDMDKVEGPYLLLSNHQTFTDFAVNSVATYPKKFAAIATFEGHHGQPKPIRAWLMEKVGCIPKRKFTTDPNLINDCLTVLHEYKNIMIIYPEARYTDIGTTSYITDEYGSLIKRLGVPVVTIVHRGNYLRSPFWDWKRKRKVKTHSIMKYILSKEEVAEKSAEEIVEIVRRELQHDEHAYQRDNNIKITEKYRAEGLNKALYQCPHCLTEFEMESKGTKLWCNHCGKTWEMDELGQLHATEGETEFSHIPDWYNWEKENVRKEVLEGRYSFEDQVDVYSLPHMRKFIHLGKATLKHSRENGVTLEGHYNGEDYKISRPSAGLYSIHTEYNYCYIKHEPCIYISIANDSFACFTSKKDCVSKVYFAVDAIHKQIKEERAQKRAEKLAKRSGNEAQE